MWIISWQTWLSVPQFQRLFGIASKDSLGWSDSLDSLICSTRFSDSISILPTPTCLSTTIMSNSRNSPSLDLTSQKPYAPWFFFWVSQTTISPLLPLSRRLLKLKTSIWVLSLVRYLWRWTFMLYTNHSIPRSLRQNLEASLLLLLLLIEPMLSNMALHLKISEEVRPPHTSQDHFVISLLAPIPWSALIPFRTPLQSPLHTIYIAPLSVLSL